MLNELIKVTKDIKENLPGTSPVNYLVNGNWAPPKDSKYDLGTSKYSWRKIYGGTVAANNAIVDPAGAVHTTELTDTNDFETESGTFNRDSPSAGTTSITLNNTYDPSCFIASIGIESGGTSATYDQAIGSGIRSYDTNANGNITGVTFYVVFVLSGGGTATFRWDAMGRTV